MASHAMAMLALVLGLARGALGSQVVNYTFDVSYFKLDPDGTGASWVQGINRMLPGPTVVVRRNDRLRVTILNHLSTEDLTVHWHGFEMRQAQEYDGAMGITQCGIKPGATFTYDFVVDEHPGTYMFHEHAHLEHVAARGFFGALVVLPEANEMPAWQYDRDEVILLSDWWGTSMHELELTKMARMTHTGTISIAGNGVGLLPFENLLINGKGAANVFAPQSEPLRQKERLFRLAPAAGETWRLRVINGGALFAMTFRIDGHRLRVVAADAAEVQPYDCDVLTMSSGERFDVLVTFNQVPGSYWMRAETLEDQPGLHHGQLGLVQYAGTSADANPSLRRPVGHRIRESPELVILNCVDLGPISPSCRPITDLRRSSGGADMGSAAEATHDFEVSMRAFFGESNGHFSRALDLGVAAAGSRHFGAGGNALGPNQFDGDFVQFNAPAVPYSYVGGTEAAHHPNTLAMRVRSGEAVRVVLQLQDRVSHPWHLHGHKFAVLGVGFPDYDRTCDVLFCRSQQNQWLTRDGLGSVRLLDPAEAPLKDTVQVPAGGWVVIQFRADNPGWWFFHCHMQIHVHDGMALILIEAPEDAPPRLTNITYLDEHLPSCDEELLAFREKGAGSACSCWQNPEMKLDQLPRGSYQCSKMYLCGGDELSGEGDPWQSSQIGRRDRASGRPWRVAMAAFWLAQLLLLFATKAFLHGRQRRAAEELRQLAGSLPSDLKLQEVGGRAGHALRQSVVEAGHSIEALPHNGVRLDFNAAARGGPQLRGTLHPGAVLAVLGATAETEKWLQLFAGRRQAGRAQVRGQVWLGGRMAQEWDTATLRAVRGYISEVQPLRRWCTVADALELALQLMRAPESNGSRKERLLQMAKISKLFKLNSHLGSNLGDLDGEVLLSVLIAQEVTLPRAILIIQEPLEKLSPPAASRMVQTFSVIAQKLQVTIIFSCRGWIPEEANRCVTHTMMVGKELGPFFCKSDQLAAQFDRMGHPAKHDKLVSLASEMVLKGQLPAAASEQSPQGGRLLSPRSSGSHSLGLRPLGLSSLRSALQTQAFRTVRAARTLWARGDRAPVAAGVRTPRCFAAQLWTLLGYQFVNDLEESLTVPRFVETVGVAVVTGLVWFQKGSTDNQTALAESIGLFFFSCALYTVPAVFQALAAAPTFAKLVVAEHLSGLYPIHTGVLAMAVSSLPTVLVWTAVWQTIAYAFADLSPNVMTMFAMNIVLALNMLAMRTLGFVLYMFVPLSTMNVVIGNLLVQLFMLTNGFYTKLQPWLQWVTVFSVPRYSFRALLKLEYAWTDTFEVHPMYGMAAFGFPSKYIPAELTATFQLMRERQMDVMQSPLVSSPQEELLIMAALSVVFLGIFLLALARRAGAAEDPRLQDSAKEEPPSEEEDSLVATGGSQPCSPRSFGAVAAVEAVEAEKRIDVTEPSQSLSGLMNAIEVAEKDASL